jgi:hypothetical protein
MPLAPLLMALLFLTSCAAHRMKVTEIDPVTGFYKITETADLNLLRRSRTAFAQAGAGENAKAAFVLAALPDVQDEDADPPAPDPNKRELDENGIPTGEVVGDPPVESEEYAMAAARGFVSGPSGITYYTEDAELSEELGDILKWAASTYSTIQGWKLLGDGVGSALDWADDAVSDGLAD